MKSVDPKLTYAQAKKALQSTSQGVECDQSACGSGIVNAARAVQQVRSDREAADAAAARKKAEEEAARKKAAEEAARKKAEEDAKRQQACTEGDPGSEGQDPPVPPGDSPLLPVASASRPHPALPLLVRCICEHLPEQYLPEQWLPEQWLLGLRDR